MRLWRISNYLDLSGIGGTVWPGRWHEKGHHVVYCADHPSTSLLEIIVHATRFAVPKNVQLIEIDVPDDVRAITPALPTDWQTDMRATREIGTRFLLDNAGPLLCVPSAILPVARNYLLNPIHPHARRVEIVGSVKYPFDARLLR